MAQLNQVTLDIDEEEETNITPQQNVTHRLDSLSRISATNRNNLGLGDRLNNVFREIRPLVEHARMSNNARLSLPTWLPRNTPSAHHQQVEISLQRPQSSIAHVNLGQNSQTYLINERAPPFPQPTQSPTATHDLNSSVSTESNLLEQDQERGDINVSVNTAINNNINDNLDNESQSEDGTHQVVDVRGTLNLLIRYAPFYFLLLIKFMYDSREGIFSFIILFFMFAHSNSLVRREHGKQTQRSFFSLYMELVSTLSGVVVVHLLFGYDKLLLNVVMFPDFKTLNIWDLIWLVVLTDLIVKIITVNIKIIIIIMPVCILPFQKRGKVFLFTEAISQLYRSILTIQPWIFYLMEAYEGSEKMVGMFLTSVYVFAKVIEIIIRLQLFKNATSALVQSVNLGTKPTSEELLAAGDSCPICHDDYTTPVRLDCSHIFCELCISAWLDREHTCPLCRAKVADEPIWRDGSTTYDFQLY